MVRYCAISQCHSTSKDRPRLSFHELPSNWERRSLWIESITNNAGHNRELRDYSFICSLHFTVDCFRPGKKKTLTASAVPTVFETHFKKKIRDTPGTKHKNVLAVNRLNNSKLLFSKLQTSSKSKSNSNFIITCFICITRID